MFADFDFDSSGRVFLRRISFDGYGCCRVEEVAKRMTIDDSRILLDSIDRGEVDDPRIETLLRTYFRENMDVIWRDALVSHELV